MLMVFDQLLHLDDLHRWRACERQFWLHRQPSPEAGVPTLAPDAQADADESAEAAVVYGPAVQAALRASFPGATTISAPT